MEWWGAVRLVNPALYLKALLNSIPGGATQLVFKLLLSLGMEESSSPLMEDYSPFPLTFDSSFPTVGGAPPPPPLPRDELGVRVVEGVGWGATPSIILENNLSPGVVPEGNKGGGSLGKSSTPSHKGWESTPSQVRRKVGVGCSNPCSKEWSSVEGGTLGMGGGGGASMSPPVGCSPPH